MKMKGAHWLLVGVVVLYLFAPAQFEQGKDTVLGAISKVPGLNSTGASQSPVLADPVILAVRPALQSQKIGFFDKDTNKNAYYIVTGNDITKASHVAGDGAYWATIRGIWRVHLSPSLVPDVTWDASGTKVLSTELLDQSCCSAKALAGVT